MINKQINSKNYNDKTKFSIKSHWLILVITIYIISALNLSFWRYIYQHATVPHFSDALFIFTIPFFIGSCLYFLLSLILWPYLTKAILIPLLIISSLTNYVMFQLGVYIDSDMIRNTVQTNQREATDLITFSGILWVFFLGIIPAVVLLFTKIKYKSPIREVSYRVLGIVICVAITVCIAAVSYKQYSAFGRNNRQLIRLINPTNYIQGTLRYYQKQALVNREFVYLDPAATRDIPENKAPRIFILAIGETSRSMNFDLNGYHKNTNPKLAKHDVISFQNVSSCGTATAISLPCMFSNMPRKSYNADSANYTENFLDLFTQTGIDILFRENDDGCKGVCKRVPTQDMVALGNLKFCDSNSCFDEVLVDDLDTYLANITKDTVLVIHMIGSHGPTYYKRYPPEFKVFNPTCDTAEIQGCSREAITNTYDNTIAYADHVLAKAIDSLKKFPELNTGLLYISDHGESLGENNIYLHGIPYSIAPKEQTSVPMILWMSKLMEQDDAINAVCMRKKAQTAELSHDNLFHSMLGLMRIKTTKYQQELDFFNSCRDKI
ncbi:membrane-associated metal-dependent hydrolase [Gammaproteobacteria bacterium]|nr:membrane-associated metal-dependent hydrolase [Gammaproteobacteria bacterium]